MSDHLPWDTLVAHADGTLPDSDAETVRAHLLRCPSCAEDARWLRHLVRTMRDEPSLSAPPASARAAVEDAFTARYGPPRTATPFVASPRLAAAPPPRPLVVEPPGQRVSRVPSMLYLWGGLAAAAVLVIALLLPRFQQGVQTASAGTMASVRGTVLSDGLPVTVGQTIMDGRTITTGAESQAELTFDNGEHRLTVEPESTLVCRGYVAGVTEVSLERGSVVAEALGAALLKVVAGGNEVEILEGRARIGVEPDGLVQIRVERGLLMLTSPDGNVPVNEGFQALVRPGEAPEVSPIPPDESQVPPPTLTPTPTLSPTVPSPTPDDSDHKDDSDDSGSGDNSGPGSDDSGSDDDPKGND